MGRTARSALVLVCALALSVAACSAGPQSGDTGTNHGDGSVARDGTGQGDGSGGMDVTTRDDTGAGLDSGSGGDDVPVVGDVINVYDTATGQDACPFGDGGICVPTAGLGCLAAEACGNGLDDNCSGMVDEGCPCLPGTVQDCFLGPPGHQHIGGCRDGTQRCSGAGEFGSWGACTGGISPSVETCDELDNDCNGCTDDGLCCRADLTCPGPGDPRVPDGQPFSAYPLRGGLFFSGTARSWNWTVMGGPCDTVLPTPAYTVTGANSQDAVFSPTLSGEYTVTLTVVTSDGRTVSCTFVVLIAGPGLRVELCWDTSTTVDLDLYLHDPRTTDPWFSSASSPLNTTTNASCNWSNCEATLRGSMGRENWGLANSPLSECQNGPLGASWRALGYCANPRLDIDNNLVMSIGTPENINVDNPTNGSHYRVMVQNFTGALAHPVINVYCGGHLRGTIGSAPDLVPGFMGAAGFGSVGAMWRAADIAVHVDAGGTTTGCDVTPLRAAGSTSGFNVTYDNPAY
ncbi:MAG: MopE-related protein [Deltaproteobacteria bacterium]